MYYSKLHISYHILPLAKLVYDFESCRNVDTIEDKQGRGNKVPPS